MVGCFRCTGGTSKGAKHTTLWFPVLYTYSNGDMHMSFKQLSFTKIDRTCQYYYLKHKTNHLAHWLFVTGKP